MKLQQLRSLVVIVENSRAAKDASSGAHTLRPELAKQLRLLETRLGFPIFAREGGLLGHTTPAGEQVVRRAHRILNDIEAIERLADDLSNEVGGTLSIATTHTQARYVLPDVIRRFRERYPAVRLHLHQGTSEQIAEMVRADHVDFAIATGSEPLFPEVVLLPAYKWRRTLVVPVDHPLADARSVTLRRLADFPIVTYTFSFSGPSSLITTFFDEGLEANVVLTARDADVIKTYVRLGLGVGIVANMAIDREEDDDLVAIDAAHLFPVHTTWIGFRRSMLLRPYMYDFMQRFASHLEPGCVDRAREAADQRTVDEVFAGVSLPLR